MSRRFSWALFFILLFLAFAFYSNSFSNAFQFDDIRQIQNNGFLKADTPTPVLARFPYRAIPYFTFWLNLKVWGESPVSFHVTNLLIHLFNAFFVFLIFRELIFLLQGLRSFGVPGVTAILFLLHPLGSEMINHVVLRTELLAAAFSFAAFWLYLRGRLYVPGFGLKQGVTFIVISLLFLCAIDAKASAVSLPLVFVLFSFLHTVRIKNSGGKRNVRFTPSVASQLLPFQGGERAEGPKRGLFMKDLSVTGVIFFILAFVFLWRKGVVWQEGYGGVLSYALTQVSVIGHYLVSYLLPFSLNVDPNYPLQPFLSAQTLGWGLLFFLLSWLLYQNRRREPVLSFLWFWMLLALAPASSLIPRSDVFFFYRFYLPSAPFLMFCIWAISRVTFKTEKRVWMLGLSLAVAAVWGALTFQRNLVFKDALTLWSDAARKSPEKARVLLNYGQALLQAHQYKQAKTLFERVLGKEPGHVGAWNNLGVVYQKLGLLAEAERCFRQILGLNKETAAVINNLAINLRRERRDKEAIALLEASLAVRQDFDHYLLLGKSYLRLGKRELAEKFLREATRLKPESAEPFLVLGDLFRSTGQDVKAKQSYLTALGKEGKRGEVLQHLGLFYKETGFDQAAGVCIQLASDVD